MFGFHFPVEIFLVMIKR